MGRSRAVRLALLASSMVLAGLLSAATDRLAQLQAQFDRETRGVAKAKLLQKLGDAQFQAARDAHLANDYSTMDLTLEKYRDNVRAASDALGKEKQDAERHSGGYRELEMHVRKGIREVDEILLVVPEEYKPPMQIVRHDLITIDDRLLRLLFPRRNEGAAAAPPSPEKQP
jgi:hypothetical protein